MGSIHMHMAGSVFIGKLLSRQASRILLVVLSLLVLVLSLIPTPELVLGAFSAYDKIGHLIAYVVLGFIAGRAVDRRGPLPFMIVTAGCAIFGGIIEIVQPLVGRRMELADFLIDLAGSMAGAAITALISRNARGGKETSPR
jgi:VanZ family protein